MRVIANPSLESPYMELKEKIVCEQCGVEINVPKNMQN